MGSMPLAESYMDQTFTDIVVSAMGPKTEPRTRQLMGSLIKHMHDFARENELTMDEWMEGMKILNWAGKLSDDKINHMQLLSDILGLESLVDEITHKAAADGKLGSTPQAVYGPFYREDAPIRENGDSIIVNKAENGKVAYMHGKVTDCVTGELVRGAVVNVWQSSTNGLYDQQDPVQMTGNLRGRFKTDKEGQYGYYCLYPTPYGIPSGGNWPSSVVLDAMDRHHFRPAHIHLVTTHDDYNTLCTQIYPKDDPYLHDDAAFAVLGALVVDFKPRKGDPNASLDLEFDIKVAPAGGEKKKFMNGKFTDL